MKKMIVLLCSALTLAGCVGGSRTIPNPGFGVLAVDQTGWYEKPLPGAITYGTWVRPRFWPPPTGDLENFRTVGGNVGEAVAPNAKAPGRWRLYGYANWGLCTGLTGYQDMDRGVDNYVPCSYRRVYAFNLLFDPNTLTAASPQEFRIDGIGMDTTYGMPTVQFYNRVGTLVAETQATSMSSDNETLTGWSGCLSSCSGGLHTVQIWNATADGAGQLAGVGNVYVNAPSACDPDGQLEQTCTDNGGLWNPTSCTCRPAPPDLCPMSSQKGDGERPNLPACNP
jgi:hypothetical protein